MHWLGITESNFNSLWILVIITNLSTLLPLAFLHWLPKEDQQIETQSLQPALPTNNEQPFLNNLILQEQESQVIE
jgi:hypothetical protein